MDYCVNVWSITYMAVLNEGELETDMQASVELFGFGFDAAGAFGFESEGALPTTVNAVPVAFACASAYCELHDHDVAPGTLVGEPTPEDFFRDIYFTVGDRPYCSTPPESLQPCYRVPEPGTVPLLMAGLLLVGIEMRRRRSRLERISL